MTAAKRHLVSVYTISLHAQRIIDGSREHKRRWLEWMIFSHVFIAIHRTPELKPIWIRVADIVSKINFSRQGKLLQCRRDSSRYDWVLGIKWVLFSSENCQLLNRFVSFSDRARCCTFTFYTLHFNLHLFQVMAQVSQSKVKRWLLRKALAAKEADLKRFLFSNKKYKLDS